MNTKEEILNISLSVGETIKSESITLIAGRVIGLVVYPNKEVRANLSVKADDGTFISKPQHILNYRSRNTCYFDGCKPVDFQTQGKTYYVEIAAAEPVENESLEVQVIFIYEDTRFNNCEN